MDLLNMSSKPFLNLPLIDPEERQFRMPKKVKVFEYFAMSDGRKKIFTNEDKLSDYGNQKIRNPDQVSFYNLFINGVLQPSSTYKIEHETLLLTTDDIPIKGSPVILQMVVL